MRAMPEQAQVDAIAAIVAAATDDVAAAPATVMAALDRLGLRGPAADAVAEQVHRAGRERGRLRRREHELTELFSSARELAEVRDTGPLLDRLVRRAHQMVRVDVTYLSEFDPGTRELHVRNTSGSVSAAFRGLRVPAGRGLASVVVETRAAQWVRRYVDYQADRHEADIDDAVAAEGLVSLLGVPMLSGDEVLGVLFVATRDEHDFSPDEIALLSALADHASVVLQTARILLDLRRSEDDARRALEQLTDHLAERDRASNVHRDLVQAVLTGHGFAPVADTLATEFGRSVAIVDVQGRLLAAAGPPPAASMLELGADTLAAIEQSRRSGRVVRVAEVPGLSAVAAFAAGPRHFGVVLLGDGPGPLGEVKRRTVERAAQVCALLALQQEAVADAELRVQNELVADILDAVPERRADVERRARRLGVTLAELDTLLLFAVAGELRVPAARALGPMLGEHALTGEYRGFVVAVFPGARVKIETEDLRVRVARALAAPVLAVAPPRAAGPPSEAFGTAMRTARLLAALDVGDLTASTDDYLPYSAVLDADPRTLRAFLDDTIGVVRRYDAERGADLLSTLRAFVRNGASPTRTARSLNFHTNTIIQRLDRLDRILGPDWRDDERLFRIGIAVRLDELRERLERTNG
jgi:hypothetical protein